ncbi:MAG: hypothetical protein ACI9YH_000056 [Colwellia sp.]|jgi:hypothetical protein
MKLYNRHIVITARDPATALSFSHILEQYKKLKAKNITLITQEPASSIIKQNFNFEESSITHIIVIQQNAVQILSKLHEEKKIDVMLIGISGPDSGIDELALTFAKKHNIRNYALQSFWGDFNQDCKVIPENIFTLDIQATKINKQRFPNTKNVEIGSLKHSNYHQLAPEKIRAITRAKFKVLQKEVIVGFYGQPLQEISGYFETIRSLVDQLSHWSKPFKLLYRAHPKESENLTLKTQLLFKQVFGDNVIQDIDPDINNGLAACDLVTSAFSTCCIDAVFLNLTAEKAINSSIYLWFNDDLIAWWQKYSQMKIMPLTNKGQSIFSVNNADSLIKTFDLALKNKQQARLKAINSMPKAKDSAKVVIMTIENGFSKLENIT